jgi:hypothetical protein
MPTRVFRQQVNGSPIPVQTAWLEGMAKEVVVAEPAVE